MFKKSIAWYLIFAMFAIAIIQHAEAAFIPSSPLASKEEQRTADLNKVQELLETKLVQQRLQDLGYNSNEIKERLSLLSDQQLHNYAQQLDDLRPGGDKLAAIIGVLVIIALVLVILHFTGHKVTV